MAIGKTGSIRQKTTNNKTTATVTDTVELVVVGNALVFDKKDTDPGVIIKYPY